MAESIGFIGAGRVARILLGGWVATGTKVGSVVAMDADDRVVDRLVAGFPELVQRGKLADTAACDLVLLALHPPAMGVLLPELAGLLRPESIVVSLAPRLTLAWLTARLGEHARVARVLPNAPSIVGSGYNPVVFGPALSAGERERVLSLFRPLGACPEVPEETVEAYALLVAMGPTYLWFQLEELRRLGREFGLAPAELDRALPAMVEGAVRTLFGSGLDRDEVLDLVPVRPLAADEESIRALYADRLPALFERLTAGR